MSRPSTGIPAHFFSTECQQNSPLLFKIKNNLIKDYSPATIYIRQFILTKKYIIHNTKVIIVINSTIPQGIPFIDLAQIFILILLSMILYLKGVTIYISMRQQLMTILENK